MIAVTGNEHTVVYSLPRNTEDGRILIQQPFKRRMCPGDLACWLLEMKGIIGQIEGRGCPSRDGKETGGKRKH